MAKKGDAMNARQKKLILIFSTIILLVATAAAIVLLVIGFLSKDEILKLTGTITTILSPSMLLGVVIKLLLNASHQKNLKDTLANAGLKDVEIKSKETKNNFAVRKIGQFTFIEKDQTIIIKFPNEKINDLNTLKDLQNDFAYFVSKKREDIMYNK